MDSSRYLGGMRPGYEIFRVRGIAVRLHPTFVILAIVVFFGAGASAAKASVWVWNLLVPIVLFTTVVLHEIGHALVAKRLGIPVIDIVVTPLGGMARMHSLHDRPKAELLISAAGPAANLLIALPLYAYFKSIDPAATVGSLIEIYPSAPTRFLSWLRIFFSFNVLLGTLNLVPIFPMDGGRILRSLLALKIGVVHATRLASRLGFVAALLLIFQPLLMPRNSLWILPLLGLFLMWTGLVERLVVEKNLVFGGGKVFFGSFRTYRNGQAIDDDAAPEKPPEIVETRGSSRMIDE